MMKHTILFLAANPLGTDRRALDEEARALQVELERSRHRDQFELVTRWAAQPLDLLRELRKLKPTIVHFSGQGGRGELGKPLQGEPPGRDIVCEPDTLSGETQHGLFFQGPDGGAQLVSAAALAQTFSAAGASVNLVVLNACYSDVQAEALLAHVKCVVGMAGSIRDDAARNFTIGFYGGLGERESVAVAYEQGRAAISLEWLRDSDLPRLKLRPGVDAKKLILAMEDPVGTTVASPVASASLSSTTLVNAWRGRVDVGIITIREDEFGAMLERLPDELGTVSGRREYNLRRLTTQHDRAYTIAVVRCATQGNAEAQQVANALLEELAPRWLLVVGIAGGAPASEFTLGDVVVSTQVCDFSVGAALNDDVHEYALHTWPAHSEALKHAANLPAIARQLGAWNDAAAIGVPRPRVRIRPKDLYGDSDWQKKIRASPPCARVVVA